MQRLLSVTALALSLLCLSPPWADAQGQDWFVPGQARPRAGGAPPSARPTRPSPAVRGPVTPQDVGPAPAQADGDPNANAPGTDSPSGPALEVALPKPPELPPLAKGTPPPTAAIGVLGVPDVMHASQAAQQVERLIGERRAKFQQDAQKEQASWREMQQSFAAQRAGLTPDQVQKRERELQERITKAQRQFRERDRLIQDAARFGLAQIEQTMVGVIRQVAESRGMNIVLHRAQVALNINEFDITDQVTAQLNKVLPVVQIPADGEPVPTVAATPAGPPTATAQATPAASPGPAPRPASPPAKP